MVTALHGSRFDSRVVTTGILADRLDAREVTTGILADRLDAREVTTGILADRLDAREVTTGILAARFGPRQTSTAQAVARFEARGLIIGRLAARFNARISTILGLAARFDARERTFGHTPARHHALFERGWNVYIRDLSDMGVAYAGFIAGTDSPKTLADVALADGDYEAEIRAADIFWDDCRDGKRLTFTVSGGVITTSSLPAIRNLRREIRRETPRLLWSVEIEYSPPDFDFGIWFGPASPVSTAGDPDYTVPYFDGQADYFRIYTQSSDLYAAVCAYTATEQGPISEIEIPWDTALPDSPPNQTAKND